MKFGRQYEIQIITPDGKQIIIRPPFTVQFTINRNTLASANDCTLDIYNLGRATRERIYKDRFVLTQYWKMIIRAGYGKLETVFQGNILEASSMKTGTEWVTKIKAFDGLYGIQNGYTSKTVAADTPKKNIYEDIIKDIPNTTAGIIGSAGKGSSPRGKVLMGKSTAVLNEETDGQYFIDREKINIIGDDEVIVRTMIVIDSNQLLSTPNRRDIYLDCEVLFYPQMEIGLLCNLNSSIRRYNGDYKIMGFTHTVTISGATSGTAKTKVALSSGSTGFGGLVQV